MLTLANELVNPAYANTGGGPPLCQRLRLAWVLSQAILKLHLFHWLHKDIRSDNIVFFKQKGNADIDFQAPYITAFGFARPDQLLLASESQYVIDDPDLALGMAYCHPDYQHSTERIKDEGSLQNTAPRQRYHRAYDIYSLGRVLLEIGLWQSLGSLKWERYKTKRSEWRDRLIQHAQRWLGFMCGAAYTDLVVRCLSTTVRSGSESAGVEDEKVREFCWTIVRVLETCVYEP